MEETKTNNLTNRYGRIRVDRKFLLQSIEEGGRELKLLFNSFFPLAIENDHERGLYEGMIYFGVSEKFRVLDEAEKPPVYEPWFTRNDDESLEMVIKEIEEEKKDIGSIPLTFPIKCIVRYLGEKPYACLPMSSLPIGEILIPGLEEASEVTVIGKEGHIALLK